jgi:two-component system, chemotaxis family, CheB/CheR fusion protein
VPQPTHLYPAGVTKKDHSYPALCVETCRLSGSGQLGKSLSAYPELFSVVDKKHKIYSKKPAIFRLPFDIGLPYLPAGNNIRLPGRPEKIQGSPAHEIDVQAEADRIVLKNHSPAGVVVNRAMEVVHFRGRTAPYLEPAPGKPSMNVLKLARNGLALELRTLIAAVLKKDAPAQREGVSFNGDGHSRTLNLSVTPLGEKGSSGSNFFLVLFDDVTSPGLPPRRALGIVKRKKSRRTKQN